MKDIAKRLEPDLRDRLQTGESQRAVARLRIPKQLTTATSWFAIIVFVQVFDYINNLIKMRELRRQFAEMQFPVAREMTACVTGRRILFWKHSSWRPSRHFLGSVDRNRIESSRIERSTHVKWKVLTIHLIDGSWVRFLVNHESAISLNAELNERP
jgi:hypothetical protein